MNSDRQAQFWHTTLRPLLVGALAAALGGVIFLALGLPAPWISGGTIGSAIAALAGLPVALPGRLRDVVFTVLGISMGAGVTPETLDHVGHWPLSLVILIATVIAIIIVNVVYLERVAGLDRSTALFSSVPGALSSVMAMAMAVRADVGRIALQQSVRLLLLVVVLPIIIALAGIPLIPQTLVTASARDLALLTGAGVGAGLAMHRLNMPGGLLNGAFLASAALHATGTVHGTLPMPVLVVCFTLLSVGIGMRLGGIGFDEMRVAATHALAAFALASGVALVGVLAVVELTGTISLGPALIAFAPGGLEAMTALSFALALDPAYVATHHFVRFIGVALGLPVFVAVAGAGASADKADDAP